VGVVAERLGLLAEELLDIGVGHLEPELVGDGVEDELARDRALRLLLEARHELLGLLARHREERLELYAPRLDLAGEAAQQLARAGLDERPGGLDRRGRDERVGDRTAETRLDLLLDLLAQPPFD